MEGGKDTKILHAEQFKLGKGRLQYVDYIETPEIEEHHEKFPFILTTNRNLEHYNSGSMTRRTNNVMLETEDYLMIHPDDAKKKDIRNGEKVRIKSARGETFIKAMITNVVKPGILSATFHFPEVELNNVGSDVKDTGAECPEYKVMSVEVEKVRD
jgi:formate dehydrogenase major subunit